MTFYTKRGMRYQELFVPLSTISQSDNENKTFTTNNALPTHDDGGKQKSELT